MNIALDTNAYSAFMRGLPAAVSAVQSADRIYLPLFVLGELRAGFEAGDQQSRNASTLDRFLQNEQVEVLLPDVGTAATYARLFVQLRKQGTPIPTNDLWIAALALQHDLALCTSDAHFQHIAGLRLC